MKGILNIDKPAGFTSHDVIAKARKILGERHIGHMGTLDPLATGVLLLGVGKAARLFDFFLNKEKTYEAVFEFGFETDTLDKCGQVTLSGGAIPETVQILKMLPYLTGKLEQIPPNYSAKNLNGRRAYDLAREGKEFTLKASQITVYSFKHLGQTDEFSHKFEIRCSGGTYIRSLCRDLAHSLNTYAVMTSLVRTQCGEFYLNGAISPEKLEQEKERALIPCENALSSLKKIELDAALYDGLVNGQKIAGGNYGKSFALYCRGELFGIASDDSGYIKITSNLKG